MSYLLYIPAIILAIIFVVFVVSGFIEYHIACARDKRWLPLIIFYLILIIILWLI